MAFGIVAPVGLFCGAYMFEFGIVALVVVPGAVAGGIPGDVVVVPDVAGEVVDVPVVDVPLVVPGAWVAANAAPAPKAVNATAKIAFLPAILMRVPPFDVRELRVHPANAAAAAMFRIAPKSP